MGNEKLIKAMLLKAEVRSNAYSDGPTGGAYAQACVDTVGDLVALLYPTLDAEQRAGILMGAIHEIEVERSGTWRYPVVTSE